MRAGPLVPLLALLAAPRAGAGEVRAEADLHLRFTSIVNRPGADVLYDPGRRTFDLAGYLVPSESDRFASTFASVLLEASALDGDLVLRLAADTGEVRRRSFPEVAEVCLLTTGTGLGPPGPLACPPLVSLSRVPVLLETVVPGPEQLTANGRPFDEEVEATWLLRELSASLAAGRAGFARLTAGRRRAVVGDGLVHDDYAAGLGVSLDLGAIGPPFEVAAAVLVPDRDWPTSGEPGRPMFTARLAWLPSLFESVSIFGAGMRETSGGVAETLRGQNVERQAVRLAREQAEPGITERERRASWLLAGTLAAPYESESTLLWFGTSGALSPWRGHRLGWTLAALEGTIDSVSVPRGALVRDVALHGRAARLTWDLDLPGDLSAGGAFLWLSGDELPEATATADGTVVPGTGPYRGFLGVAPFIPHTNLFFGGGLTNTFAAREATAPGVNGRGVLAPSARLGWNPSRAFGLEVRGAWLRADVAGPYGGREYGWELDLTATFLPAAWLSFGLEVDGFWPGDFYGGDDTVYRTVLAVDVLTP